MELEQEILDFVYNNLNFEILDLLFRGITYSGNKGILFVAISVGLSLHKKTRKIGITCLISLAIGGLITNVSLKPFVGRIRPFESSNVILKIMKPTDYSFPSGHTTASFAVAFVMLKEKLMYCNKKIYGYAMIYASLLAYSRIYFYVHYPSDILMGIFVGYLSSVISRLLVDKFYIN